MQCKEEVQELQSVRQPDNEDPKPILHAHPSVVESPGPVRERGERGVGVEVRVDAHGRLRERTLQLAYKPRKATKELALCQMSVGVGAAGWSSCASRNW